MLIVRDSPTSEVVKVAAATNTNIAVIRRLPAVCDVSEDDNVKLVTCVRGIISIQVSLLRSVRGLAAAATAIALQTAAISRIRHGPIGCMATSGIRVQNLASCM